MKILMCDRFDESLPARLAKFGEVITDMERIAEADVALIRSKTKCTKEWLDKATNLKLIIRGGVGLDNVDRDYAVSKGIEVTNTPEASSIAVAELAMVLMIAMPNQLVRAHSSMAHGEWLKSQIKRTELYGKTLGIVGLGRIGSEVAKRAAAFGMKIIAYDKEKKTSDVAELQSDLDSVLRQSDYLSLHLPLTPETEGIICAETIAKMKDGVYIVNTGRGKCIIEEEMVAALKSGKVAGYATDVWYKDPPENSPLVNAPNVLMMPHIGASSSENLLRIGDVIEKRLEIWQSCG